MTCNYSCAHSFLNLDYAHSAWSESGWGVQGGQVQILKIIANDFIRDTDYWENKAIVRNARTLSVALTYNM